MKNTWLLFILFLVAAVCLSPSCKKKTEDSTDISLLPAATQTGANTAGYLINGQALLPKAPPYSGNSVYQCNYIYTKGDYFFTLAFDDETDNANIKDVIIATDSLAIAEGQTYNLKNVFLPRNASGSYVVFNNAGINEYNTNTTVTGQLHITRFDQSKQIVSGTFYFDAINKSGDIMHVTDGRFDMQYTR